eukprot:6478668-Amphidinium_carterae.3
MPANVPVSILTSSASAVDMRRTLTMYGISGICIAFICSASPATSTCANASGEVASPSFDLPLPLLFPLSGDCWPRMSEYKVCVMSSRTLA